MSTSASAAIAGTSSSERMEKNPVLSLGCGVMRVLPASSTALRTAFCGVSGFTLTHSASLKHWSAVRFAAALSALTKFGMRWWTGLGNCATLVSSIRSHIRLRMAHFHSP